MKSDARKLSAEAQEEKRKQAICLHKKGLRYKDIAGLVGVHFEIIGKWVQIYNAEGIKGVALKVRGRKAGSGRALTADQEKEIQSLITDTTPDQLKQAYEQNPAKVKKWLDEEYPEIKAKAKQENAEIYWGDETGLGSNTQHGRSYASKGKPPAIRLSAKRTSSNMVSAISNQGKIRFQVYSGTMNADRLIGFLKRLTKDAKRKVILILDNLRVHQAKVVKA